MGGGGGSSSSSSNSTVTNTTDKRMVVDTGVGISSESSSVTVNTLDAGIVSKALDTVASADATNGEGFTQLLGLASKLFDTGNKLISDTGDMAMQAVSAANTAANDSKGRIDQKTLVILAAGAAAVAYAMKGK